MVATLKITRHYDFQGQQIWNALAQPLASAPTGAEGRFYYDSTLKQFGVYQNGAWAYLGAAQTAAQIQQIVANMFTGGSQTPITSAYDSTNKWINLGVAAGSITNTMLASGISADKIVDGTTNAYYTLAERSKLAGVASGATNYTDTNARANRLDQFAAPTSAVSFNSQNITNLADPTTAQQAATKNYVDTGNASQSTADRSRANHTGTQTASTISDFDTQVRTSRLDQLAAPTSAVSFNSQRLTAVAAPAAGTDAANRDYVDGAVVAAQNGLDPKGSVRAVSTTNISLTAPGATIGGVTMATGNRFLAAGQTSGSDNGIYVWNGASATATRATDADASSEVTSGLVTFVEEGGGAGQQWVLTTANPITLGTTSLAFSIYTGASSTTAGAGLVANGNRFDIGAGTGIVVNADSIQIDTTVVVREYTFTIGDGSALTFTLTHNAGRRNLIYSVMDASSYELIDAKITSTTVNAATAEFNVAPTSGQYIVTLHIRG